MSAIDLSYARNTQTAPTQIRRMAMSILGWIIGWAIFEGDNPIAVGHFAIRAHMDGKVVPHYHRNMGAVRTLVKLAMDHNVNVVVAHTKDTSSALWALPSTVAMCIDGTYADFPDWKDHVGADMKTLRQWVTVSTGRPAANDQEVLALGLGRAAVGSRAGSKVGQGQLQLEVNS